MAILLKNTVSALNFHKQMGMNIVCRKIMAIITYLLPDTMACNCGL